MRKVSVCFASAALAAVVFSPPAEAFGLRVGPFHIGLPYLGYRHHHHPLYMRAAPNPSEASRQESAPAQATSPSDMNSALLYPGVALSAIFQNIFWPTSSTWPFGYQEIFSTAFAKAPAGQDPRLCQQPDSSNAIVGRIRDQVAPTPDQMRLLQRLGGALSAAAGSLAKSCANETPAQPTARLQLMGSRIEQLTMAVDMIRQPLQDFGQSLNDEQKARFAVMIEAPAATDQQRQSDTAARSCGASLATVDWSIGQIDQTVQPTDEQLGALTEVRQALGKAASDLEAHCPTSVPPTALGRLQNIQARLDSTWRAVLAIQVALANFETKLSDEQKNRFETMDFAAR